MQEKNLDKGCRRVRFDDKSGKRRGPGPGTPKAGDLEWAFKGRRVSYMRVIVEKKNRKKLIIWYFQNVGGKSLEQLVNYGEVAEASRNGTSGGGKKSAVFHYVKRSSHIKVIEEKRGRVGTNFLYQEREKSEGGD